MNTRLFALLIVVCVWFKPTLASDPPNVVFILSDDQAWTDYGFMGHPDIQTPHLDALARRSLVFERGYVASPLCRPSLASMLTGRYPFEHGITGNDVDGKNQRAALDAPMREAFHQYASFVRWLTDRGYLAHQSGKWWEGSWSDGGFTDGMTHGDPQRGGRHGDEGLKIGRETMRPVTEFIDRATQANKPFLVWYAPFMPHSPHNPPKRLWDKYRRDGRAEDVACYDAMCEWFDETCGVLLDHLDAKGVRENTLVIYICDNGWMPISTNADDPNQKQWRQYALRSKGSPYEYGIRTPIMISWPDRIRAGRSDDLAHAIDIFPTIAAAVGERPPADLPGINLMDDNARSKRQAVYGVTHAIHNMTPDAPDDTLQYLWCVEDDWKLLVRYHGKDTTLYRDVHSWDDQPVRLYHLKTDPHEKIEVSANHPDVVSRMRRQIEAWHLVDLK
ncbi:sulfatase family protein [Neorhodopirellula pilleata]|uniref:Arylsulfatase n=1 Tax=Neorhodopirellula pilleata TaxID=2714738 RepID=A0A5C5ZQP9_9BACT|nr:sulfatase-like hydrolase/transferase [Neorhodopirellula pilleata]TWT89388.1 Arylsulfatase [Neorhodopirellula pilleata]